MANLSISYDDQKADAYTVRGDYYRAIGNTNKAIKEYERAIRLNPNDYIPYYGMGQVFSEMDLVKSIINYQKAINLIRGQQLPQLLREIGWVYFYAGFPEKYSHYALEAIKLDGDSVRYYDNLLTSELWLGHFEKSVEYGIKAYAMDSTYSATLSGSGQVYSMLGQHGISLMY